MREMRSPNSPHDFLHVSLPCSYRGGQMTSAGHWIEDRSSFFPGLREGRAKHHHPPFSSDVKTTCSS